MMIETTVGNFELINNTKDAFDIVKFQDRYVPEAFDRYDYIVGDIASELLRLKGFSVNVKDKNNVKIIPDYLNEYCNFNCGYFILKRIK
ncbi:MAG TPA: YutD-like domain-containing protein [Acholeplasma sp.]|nr:YutD-like domain-containing protein [Acholeplasma sp.]